MKPNRNIFKSINNIFEKQTNEISEKEFDSQILKIFGEGEQKYSPKEFFSRIRKARKFA